MLQKTLFLVLFTLMIFSSLRLFCQEEDSQVLGFKRGFLVKSNGDSLIGRISNPFKDGISGSVYFRGKEGMRVKYSPFEVARFGIYKSGKVYTSNEIPLKQGSELLFARILIDGDYDLLYYDFLGTNHFLIRSPGGYITDLSGRQIINTDKLTDKLSDSLFAQNLKRAFADKPEILSGHDHFKQNKKSLIRLLSNYYLKNGSKYVNYNGFGKMIFAEIILGSVFNRFVPFPSARSLQNSYTPSPYAGIGFLAVNNNTGLGIFAQSVFGVNQYHFSFSGITTSGTEFSESFIKSYISTTRAGFSAGTVSKKMIKPFFELGPVASVLISPKYENYNDFLRGSDGVVFSYHNHDKLYPDVYYGAFVRTGISLNFKKMNPLMISVGYDYMLSNRDSRINSVDLEFSYRLKFR
jgi:hypothetical protein